MTKLYLESKHLDMVKYILKKNIVERKVIAFGSRVTGNHKAHSDLDLCIMGDKPLTIMQMAALKEDFSESNLPIRVDIVDWSSISSEFQKIIKNCYFEINF